eukprot:s2218_g12.t1
MARENELSGRPRDALQQSTAQHNTAQQKQQAAEMRHLRAGALPIELRKLLFKRAWQLLTARPQRGQGQPHRDLFGPASCLVPKSRMTKLAGPQSVPVSGWAFFFSIGLRSCHVATVGEPRLAAKMAMRRAHSRALLIISVLCLLGIGLDFVTPDISIIEGLQEMSILSGQMGNVMADAGVGEAIASETDQAQATQLVLALVSGTGAMLGARRRQIRKTREQVDEMSKTRPIGASCDRCEFTLKRWWNVDLRLPTPTRLGDSMQKLLADNNTHECCERQEAQGPDMAEGIEGSQLSQARRLSRGAVGVHEVRLPLDEAGGKRSGYSSLPISALAQWRVPSHARNSGGWLGICRSRDVPTDRLANRARTLVPFVYFLHLLGFTMQGPILPALRAHFHLRASQTGLITSAFPTGMLVALFFYPRLSDVWGRKPVLLVCLTGVGVGFLLQTYALKLHWSFRTFLKLRILSGTFAGAAVVIKAFMADLEPEIMLRAVANREAAATLAFIAGPMLGGLIYGYGSGGILRVTLCAALMQLVAASLVHQFLEGMPPPGGEVRKGESENTTRELPSFGLASILLCNLILIHILYTCGAAVFDSFFGVWCIDTFGWTPARLGSALTAAACFAFCTNAFAYRRYMLKPTRTVAGAVIGLASIGLSFAAMSIAKKPLVVMAILCCQSFGITFFNPSVNILIARCCPRGSRGVIFAMDSIACSLGRICSPSIAGHFYDLGPGAAFRVVSWALMTAAGLMASQWRLLNSFIPTAKNALSINSKSRTLALLGALPRSTRMPSVNCFPEGNQEAVKQLHPVLQPPPGLPPPSLKTPSSAILEALARVQADCASQALDAAILAATAKPSMTHSRQNSKSWCESWSQASTASEEPEDLHGDFEDKVKPNTELLWRIGARAELSTRTTCICHTSSPKCSDCPGRRAEAAHGMMRSRRAEELCIGPNHHCLVEAARKTLLG